MLIYTTIQMLILSLLAMATMYILIFAVAGFFYRQPKYNQFRKFKKIAVLIPGYKEDDVILEVARHALQHKYPELYFDVIIIADSFKRETLIALSALPVQLLQVKFEKSTKAKALNSAMASLTKKYDIAVVLDADNLMAPDFLRKINAAFEQDCLAVQGHRSAKNSNNSWAILDAVSEEINNNIFRKGHRALGLSSAIIGSGMAFQYDYFKALMSTVTAVGGFDKEIELKMLKDGHKILYLDDAIVFDEKIQKTDAFENQRRRWLSAQLHYFRKDFVHALKALFLKGNIDYFDKIIQFIQPPRILLLGAVLIFGTGFLTVNAALNINHLFSICWTTIISCCLFALLISIPAKFFNGRTLLALAGLPKGMMMMFLSLTKIKGANNNFIHTKHSTNIQVK